MIASTPLLRRARPAARAGAALLSAAVLLGLAGCAAGVGIGIPLLPGVSLNVGVGSGGPSIGLGTGWGPVGAGIGVNGNGQVVGSAGVGAAAGPVGVGVGRSVVLHDPQATAPVSSDPAADAEPGGERDVRVPPDAPRPTR